ncbi:MAG TPA: hypothetical protein PKY88_07995 [Anaerohalosphaeraceae bacterium]|mgnify:CR=1 FL=1|nr:hypothetical protein [Anaerohalosphaeraceae bacterium]
MSSDSLTAFQKEVLAVLEGGIEVIAEPYHSIARRLGCSVQQVLEEIERLKKQGLIRRFRGQLDYRLLGRTACLVTASVPPDRMEQVNTLVRELPGVSHQYIRDHLFNLWFTLQAESEEQIQQTLADLSSRCGLVFYALPAIRMFKLQVRFLAAPPADERADAGFQPSEPVKLNERQKRVLMFLQSDFPVVPHPFAQCPEMAEMDCLDAVQELMHKGILKRIAAVLNHYRLGFAVNAMVCAQVPEDRIEAAGASLASFRQVSHCYQRRTFPGWPYNLFAMVHCRSEEELNGWIKQAEKAAGPGDWVILRTVREIKKEPVRLDFA